MPELNAADREFLTKITEIIEENISNERFGVSELADAIAMSRSNLLRKVKKLTKLSVSLFIRQIRLTKGMEMLKQTSSTVSEVSYEVGFSSVSYFIKCFRDNYGYPPGEVGKREESETELIGIEDKPVSKKKKTMLIGAIAIVGLLAIVFLIFFNPFTSTSKELEKSIAVLPFKNDSNDSTNVYIINGLMESILNHLQKVKDLRVISRTSVEKYRNSDMTLPEIAKELNVSYFVEGSGQKIGDKIMLNIQLIEGENDKHLWAEQYNRGTEDIFKIQVEVAKNIAAKVEAIITPEEEKRINKIPTENLVAYDYFLRAIDFLNLRTKEGIDKAIPLLEKAIAEDDKFAHAYAVLAIAYYYLDIYQIEKKYTGKINTYADQAMLADPKLSESLFAKGLFYMHVKEYQEALPYLEKALEYNPNSALVLNFLSDFYTNYIPNSEKYLEYALKGISIDIASNDSTTRSFIYLHLSNAFIQTGFTAEAEKYINKSLAFNPNNIYSGYVKAYILYAKNKDLEQTSDLLLEVLKKDTGRVDVIQEIANIYYYLRDYKSAYKYYKKLNEIKKALNLDIYNHKNLQIALVYRDMAKQEESEEFVQKFYDYAQKDISIYKNLLLSMYFAYKNDNKKAIEHLRLFSKEKNYHYWTILFSDKDPLYDKIKDQAEFKQIMQKLKDKFWEKHEQIKSSLKNKELI